MAAGTVPVEEVLRAAVAEGMLSEGALAMFA